VAIDELEEILRDFKLGDYALLVDHPRKVYRVLDIFDDSPRKKPWSENYEVVLEDVFSKKQQYVTKDQLIQLNSDQQRLVKLLYD